MPSFRSAAAQARHQVELASVIGTAKPASESSFIHSLGTQRVYAVSLGLLGRWMRDRRMGTDLRQLTEDQALQWLCERSEEVGQKCLDNDRIAISKTLGFSLPRIPSNHDDERRLAEQSRAYTAVQIARIQDHQSERNRFATQVIASAGLRAHETLTLRPALARPATSDREWSSERFLGLSGQRYTVVGKGGLIREVLIPHALAVHLESHRLLRPVTVRDRQINYLVHYDIAGGNAWSKSFSQASERAFGYSHGGHGLRHSYAQARMAELQGRGLAFDSALAIVSQELGHFRPDITEVYLR